MVQVLFEITNLTDNTNLQKRACVNNLGHSLNDAATWWIPLVSRMPADIQPTVYVCGVVFTMHSKKYWHFMSKYLFTYG